jgi:uncharacterized protein YdhG (YjbR/CyaY superfamily)
VTPEGVWWEGKIRKPFFGEKCQLLRLFCMKATQTNVDAYIAAAPKEVQTKLKQLRAAITLAAPSATEYISYGMPVYKYERPFIGFAAMKNHIGLYPMSGSFVAAHQKELAGYSTSKGAIRLPIDKPLPLGLVKRVVRLRVRETEQS